MHEIRIPRLGWSMEQGTFVRWLKNHGEPVKKGDALFELEGDKNVQEIESVEAGVLNIPVDSPQPGTTVDVGTLLGWLLKAGEKMPEMQSQAASGVEKNATEDKDLKTAGPAARRLAAEMGLDLNQITGTGRSGLITKEDVSAAVEFRAGQLQSSNMNIIGSERKIIATPRARRVAREQGVDWKKISGTGRDGRIREIDVLNWAGTRIDQKSAEIPAGQGLSPRRRAIADRLRRSQELTVPVTLHSVADVTELVALRERLKVSNRNAVASFTDLIAALLPRVFRTHPQMAQVWDASHEGLISFDPAEMNIGVAVDTPQGLLVPVLREVARKTLVEVTNESKMLIDLARSGGLKGESMRGGHFTITNLGAFGIDGFTPVINLPEIAILGLGAIRREPVYMTDGRLEPRQRMTLSLTFDHAAVDGAPAAAFLRDVAGALADPAAFLLNSSV